MNSSCSLKNARSLILLQFDFRSHVSQSNPSRFQLQFNATVQCYILRSKKTGVFKLFLDDGDHFLLASKKRNNGMNKSANYLVSIDEDDLNR